MIIKRNNKGFSLLELLLTIGVLTGLMIAVFAVMQNYAVKMQSRKTAEILASIDNAIEGLLSDPAHFNSIYVSVDATTNDVVSISVDDLINGTGIIPVSVDNLNNNISATTPWKVGYDIMLRSIPDDPSDPSDTRALEVIIATNERVDNKRVAQAAFYLKGEGGYYLGTDSKIPNAVESVFNAWNFPFANLSATSWGAAVASAPPSYDDGVYLVHYDYYNQDNLTGDYLYRNYISGSEELNRMYAPLNMGNNNLLNVDDLNVSDNLTVSSKAYVNGAMRVGGTTRIQEGNFMSDRSVNTTTTNIRGMGLGNGYTGNFDHAGELTTDTTNANSLSAQTATLENGNLDAGTIYARDASVNVNAATEVGTNVSTSNLAGNAPELNTSVLNASSLNSNNLNIQNSGVVRTEDITVSNGFTMEGGHTLTTNGELTINNLKTDNFNSCDRGC